MVSPVIVQFNLTKELNFDALMFQFVAWSFQCYVDLFDQKNRDIKIIKQKIIR